MAPGDPDKLIVILMNKVNALEDRIGMLERFMSMDDETIQRAMTEKEDFSEEEYAEEGVIYRQY